MKPLEVSLSLFGVFDQSTESVESVSVLARNWIAFSWESEVDVFFFEATTYELGEGGKLEFLKSLTFGLKDGSEVLEDKD